MDDEQACLAVMKFVNEHRFWAPSLRGCDPGISDPIVLLNCFTPTICQQDAAVLCAALWSALGYPTRFWQLGGHTTSEVYYGGRWRNLDATFPEVARGEDGSITGVVEGNRRYKPGVSYVPPWDDYEIGHRMDISLRRGESFTRYWEPLSREPDYWRPTAYGRRPHDKGQERRSLREIMGKKPYRFETKGCGYANGRWMFKPDFRDPRWRDLVEQAENVAAPANGDGYVHPASHDQPATLVFRVYTPYIITGGWLAAETVRQADDEVSVMVSTDNGAKWTQVWQMAKAGQEQAKIPLRPSAAGKFGYLLRIVMRGRGVGVRNIGIETVVQVNPLSLPALRLGPNTIRVDIAEQTERVTFRPDIDSREYRSEIVEEQNLITAREQLQPDWVRGLCVKRPGRPAHLIARLAAPGEIRSVHWGGRLRAGAARLFYSFDGKDWREQTASPKYAPSRKDAPKQFVAVYQAIPTVPENQRSVYLKYQFQRPEPNEMSDLWVATALRADVDYVPKGLGALPPVKVTYCWAETKDGRKQEKEVARTIDSVPAAFEVNVDGAEKPIMKWMRMEY